MTRTNGTQAKELGSLRRAADVVKRFFARRRAAENAAPDASASTTHQDTPVANAAKPARVTRRVADIPLDVIDRTYTPPFTGAKASFRSDGADHQQDQDFAYGVADDRWNDEDRLTNRSGDPRIGTHGRTYEPGEARTESHD